MARPPTFQELFRLAPEAALRSLDLQYGIASRGYRESQMGPLHATWSKALVRLGWLMYEDESSWLWSRPGSTASVIIDGDRVRFSEQGKLALVQYLLENPHG